MQIKLHDKTFKTYISAEKISEAVNKIAERINIDYKNRSPIFLSVLNGAFMFTSDLLKQVSIPCELSFIKLASYQGVQSTGNIKTLIGLDLQLNNRSVIIIEDIVDTGKTMIEFIPMLKSMGANDIEIAALLVKPDALRFDIDVKYKGLEIPNDFIVGYGLDYNGLGRNLRDIYVIVN